MEGPAKLLTNRPGQLRNRTPQAVGVQNTQIGHLADKIQESHNEKVDQIQEQETKKKRIIHLITGGKAPIYETQSAVSNVQKLLKKSKSKIQVLEQDEVCDDAKENSNIVDYRGMKMTLQQRDEYIQMENQQILKFKSQYYPAKFASKKNGVVVSYAANTHQGMVRNYNEDRVSIILNIIQPKQKILEVWPRCSFFAIYDGHGGALCADFLRDQLHQLIVKDPAFPQDPKLALARAFHQAELEFLRTAHLESIGGELQKSGSCAVAILIVGEIAYVANTGDSRAVMCVNGGKNFVQLTSDHKPEEPSEKARIESKGGRVYQNFSYIPDPTPNSLTGQQTLAGPYRVEPGRLSVSRTIGDIEAKDPRYGGNPEVVICTPDVRCFKIDSSFDFIIMGCDGIFEKLDNQTLLKTVLTNATKAGNQTVHERSGQVIDGILNACVENKTLDNITSVLIGFQGFEQIVESKKVFDLTEIFFDWDAVGKEASDESMKLLTQYIKPLEAVIEEASEPETPTSETKQQRKNKRGHNRQQTSIMSSKRPSGSTAPLEETIITEKETERKKSAVKKEIQPSLAVEEQAGPVVQTKASPKMIAKFYSQPVEKKSFDDIRSSKELKVAQQQTHQVVATTKVRSGSSNGRRTIVINPSHQSQQQIPITTTNRAEIPKKTVFRKFSLNSQNKPQAGTLRPLTPKRFAEKSTGLPIQVPEKSSSTGNKTQVLKQSDLNFYDKTAWATQTQTFSQLAPQSLNKASAIVNSIPFKSQRAIHTDLSDEVAKRRQPKIIQQHKTPTANNNSLIPATIEINQNRKSGSRNAPAHQRQQLGATQSLTLNNQSAMQPVIVLDNKTWQSNLVSIGQKQKLSDQLINKIKLNVQSGVHNSRSHQVPHYVPHTVGNKSAKAGISHGQLKEAMF